MAIKREFSRAIILQFIILILLTIIVLAQAQNEGLVAEWRFEDIGNILTDSSGNGNNGVIYGATFVEGMYGKALSFDGVDDYVEIQDRPALKPSAISIEAWVKINDFTYYGGHNIQYIIFKKNSQVSNFEGYSFWLEDQRLGLSVASSYGAQVGVYSDPINLNQWYHIVITADSNKMALYLNGTLKMQKNTGFSLDYGDRPIFIGRSGESWDGIFNGALDDVRIYNRVLSPEEIKEHYGQETTGLSITRTVSPWSIKQDQTSTITVTVKNTGSTEISDVEIVDTIPKDINLIDGELSKIYASISPNDTRSFQYIIQINDVGIFNIEPTTVRYADNKGNYHTVKSKPISIEVISSLIEGPRQTVPKKSNSNVRSASVNLYGEKTDVMFGEDVLLKLSAVNIIGNPMMHVQVIIIPPNGWSVTSSEFSKSGAGQYATMYDLKPEDGSRDIEVKIVPNQIGDNFEVKGRIIYYFGDDISTREDHTLDLPIKVREKVDRSTPIQQHTSQPTTPGFAIEIAIIGILLMILFIRKRC